MKLWMKQCICFIKCACIAASCISHSNALHANSANEAAKEITVQLDTEIPLLPLFLSHIDTHGHSAFSAMYLTELRKVLDFDLSYNGATRVLSQDEQKVLLSLKEQDKFDETVNFDALKKDGVLYLVKLALNDKILTAKIISTNSQSQQRIDNISLTGELNKDRATLHALSDAIHNILFGEPGIASCKILYVMKQTIPPAKKGQEAKVVAEVFESDYDGNNSRQLTHEGTLCTNPFFIPSINGHRPSSFCFVSYKIGQPKVYYSSLKEIRPKRVSSLKGNQLTPSISQNGHNILFICDYTGTSDIFLQTFRKDAGAIGKPRHIYAAKGAAEASPVFSPDGTKIAFVSDKDGSPKIYVMDLPKEGAKLKDLKPVLITKRCRENSAPSWSPDGKKLAYSAKNSGPRQIWIYDFETKKERELTQGKAIKENPSWAPDSFHLLFNAKEGKSSDIYLINLNQPEAVKITSGNFEKMFPSWEPRYNE